MRLLLSKTGVWIAAAAVILLAPTLFQSGFALSVMGQMGVAIIFALAYNMLLGQGGMLSFGHAVYFGLAGYFSIHYLNLMGEGLVWYFPVSLLPLFGGVVGLFFGVLIGFVSTRRAGTTFAMISLGFSEMATALTLILVAFFNGEEGIQTDRWVGPEPFGITYGPDIQVYYLIGIWCFVAMVAMYALTKTPFGRMSNAVRDNPERAQFVGYNTQRVRWLAFSLSSFFAGLAGALHAINFEHVGFETVGLAQSGFVLFMVFIGGVRHYLGPILGAVLITLLTATLGDLTQAWFLYFGIFFVVMVVFAPGGLAGLIMLHEPVWKTDIRLAQRMILPYMGGLITALIAGFGLIGLIEMIYFVSHKLAGDTDVLLYGFATDVSSIYSWLIYGTIAATGIVLCRKSFPAVRGSWNSAMDDVRERFSA
ncbi:MAG: branched-chain amino acid ABC transporter permease [SAR324 cluster bacterium]|nr:branched-chain amino acid ABC transporter permease [SAR324 cluster bacterium]